MNALPGLFSHREIAVYVWTLILGIWALGKPPLRRAVGGLVRSFVTPKVLLPVLGLCLYSTLVVVGLRGIGLWDVSLLKDTVLWMLSAGIAALVSSATAKDATAVFRRDAAEVLTVAVLLEFVLNLYSFPLWLELGTIPLVGLAVLLRSLARRQEQHRPLVKPLDWLVGAYALAVIAVSAYQAISHFDDVASIGNLRSFVLPLALSLAALPYLYLFALAASYEQVFLRLRLATDDPGVRRYAKREIVRTFHLRLSKLQSWNRSVGLLQASTRGEVHALLDRRPE